MESSYDFQLKSGNGFMVIGRCFTNDSFSSLACDFARTEEDADRDAIQKKFIKKNLSILKTEYPGVDDTKAFGFYNKISMSRGDSASDSTELEILFAKAFSQGHGVVLEIAKKSSDEKKYATVAKEFIKSHLPLEKKADPTTPKAKSQPTTPRKKEDKDNSANAEPATPNKKKESAIDIKNKNDPESPGTLKKKKTEARVDDKSGKIKKVK